MDLFWPIWHPACTDTDFLHLKALIQVTIKEKLRKGENVIESLTRSQSTFRKNGWPMISAKPVWGWQPRRSLGSCGRECERKVRDSGRWWWKNKITSPIPNKKGGEIEKKEFAGSVYKKGKKTRIKRKRWPCLRLIQACVTLSYLVEESFEDAGSFDWQRAWDSDLFFQYYCRRWQKNKGHKGVLGRQGEERMRLKARRWYRRCCCCYELNPAGSLSMAIKHLKIWLCKPTSPVIKRKTQYKTIFILK